MSEAPTTKEVLVKAKELIQDPKHWIQGTFARDSEGRGVAVYVPEAVCFCSLGAMRRASLNYPIPEPVLKAFVAGIYEVPLEEVGHNVYMMKDGITSFNDKPGRTHARVLEVFDKAIEIAGD